MLDLARATLCGDRACRGCEMQVRLRFIVCLEGCARANGLYIYIFIVFAAQNAGKAFQFLRSLVENTRLSRFHSHFLRMSHAKRSFWKPRYQAFLFFTTVFCGNCSYNIVIVYLFDGMSA